MNRYNHFILSLFISFSCAIPISCMQYSKTFFSGSAIKKKLMVGGVGSAFAFGIYHEIGYRKALKDVAPLQHAGLWPIHDPETGEPIEDLPRAKAFFDKKQKLHDTARRHKRYAFMTNLKESVFRN